MGGGRDREVAGERDSFGDRLGRAGLRGSPQCDGSGDGDRAVHNVRQDTRQRRPLREDAGDARAETESAGQAHRCPSRTGTVRGRGIPRRGRQFLHPAAADGHAEAERDPAQDAADDEHGRRVGAEGQERGAGDRQERCREQDRPSAQPVGQWSAEEEGGHDSDNVGKQEQIDRDRRETVIGAVHAEERREFVAAPRDREHGRGHQQPGARRREGLRHLDRGFADDGHRATPLGLRAWTWRMWTSTAASNPAASPASTSSVSCSWSAMILGSCPGSRVIECAVMRR